LSLESTKQDVLEPVNRAGSSRPPDISPSIQSWATCTTLASKCKEELPLKLTTWKKRGCWDVENNCFKRENLEGMSHTPSSLPTPASKVLGLGEHVRDREGQEGMFCPLQDICHLGGRGTKQQYSVFSKRIPIKACDFVVATDSGPFPSKVSLCGLSMMWSYHLSIKERLCLPQCSLQMSLPCGCCCRATRSSPGLPNLLPPQPAHTAGLGRVYNKSYFLQSRNSLMASHIQDEN
jgi:hypothetical protein